MNFKGWVVKILFDADFYIKCESLESMADKVEFLGDLSKKYKPTIERLIFECEYIPRKGDWVSGRAGCDGAYIGSVAFMEYPGPPEILVYLTEQNPTN